MAHRPGHRQHADFFGQADPSVHMLGFPKSHPRLGTWLVLAILSATVLGLAVVMLENLIF